ncbi:MAG: DNA polymerase/3'-5' exonuclease PolX [Acidobacteriota bacterium]
MPDNRALADRFDEMASALELLGANRFKVNANSRVARIVRDRTDDVAAFVRDDPDTAIARLSGWDGIGKGSAEKIVEFVETGAIAEHASLRDRVPAGLFDVLDVPGIGPKAARAMWQNLGVDSVDALEQALDTPAFAALPRMGKKTIDNIRRALVWRKQAGGRTPIGRARPLARDLAARLGALDGVEQIDFAGSLRRGRETIGDLDFLVACAEDRADAVREAFIGMPEVQEVLANGPRKCSVRLAAADGVAMQADLRLVPRDVYGAALMYFTGSKEHNVLLRERAIQRDMRLNEYGLFEGTDERPQDDGAAPIAAADEIDVYRALGLPWIPPELREDRGDSLERVGDPVRLETLIRLEDIRAELHAHTTASDGVLSIDALADEAVARGFHTIAVTDHSQSAAVANGLSPARLREHIAAVRDADARRDDIRILAGAEVDILADGRLDYDDDLLAALDLVVASPHVALRQAPEEATARLLAAIRHPLVHILGHPTGRIIQKREGLAPDMEQLFAAAVEHDVALELNANWHRLDLRDVHLRGALAAGCKIAINTDAHDAPHFDFLDYGVVTARRAGVSRDACVNAWDAGRLHDWLQAKR